jgi:hypothetical protein
MFYLDYILYPLIALLFAVFIHLTVEHKNQEGFEHRGNEQLARGKSKKPSPGLLALLVKIIEAIYNVLLMFARIVTAPVKFTNNIVSSFKQTYYNLKQIFLTMGTVLRNLTDILNGTIGGVINKFGDKIGLDNYDLGAPGKFLKSLTKR